MSDVASRHSAPPRADSAVESDSGGIAINVTVDDAELERSLKAIGLSATKDALDGAMNEIDGLLIEHMQEHIPVRYGLLKKSIGVRKRKYGEFVRTDIVGARRNMGSIQGGSFRDPAKYAHLVEDGHMIVPRGKAGGPKTTRGAIGKVEGSHYRRGAKAAVEPHYTEIATKHLRQAVEAAH